MSFVSGRIVRTWSCEIKAGSVAARISLKLPAQWRSRVAVASIHGRTARFSLIVVDCDSSHDDRRLVRESRRQIAPEERTCRLLKSRVDSAA